MQRPAELVPILRDSLMRREGFGKQRKVAAFWRNPDKIWQNSAKLWQNFRISFFCKLSNITANFKKNFEIRARCKEESSVLSRAASRLRQAIVEQTAQLQRLRSAEPPRPSKGRQHKSPQAKLDSLQRALKKNQDEVEHLDRLILSNKRFLPSEEPLCIISPSPAGGPLPVIHWTRF